MSLAWRLDWDSLKNTEAQYIHLVHVGKLR